jgi:hypothetical protein
MDIIRITSVSVLVTLLFFISGAFFTKPAFTQNMVTKEYIFVAEKSNNEQKEEEEEDDDDEDC